MLSAKVAEQKTCKPPWSRWLPHIVCKCKYNVAYTCTVQKNLFFFLDTMNTQVHETTKAMPYELVFGQPPRSIIILEPRLKGTIDEEQLDEKDDDITDDEVVKEEKECNSDESSTEDIKQETYNEEGKNELLKFEMSMQQQVKQQLTDPHNHNLLFVQFGKCHCMQLTLRRSLLKMQRIAVNPWA